MTLAGLVTSSHNYHHRACSSCGGSMMSPNLTIDDIPDEVLLDIFDSYRQHFTNDQSVWNKKHKWFKLMHVCRKWRCIVFASSTRLDLCLFVSNTNPGNMKTIFSPHLPPLPIAINHDYHHTGTASLKTKEFSCMFTACSRVRGLTFSGTAPDFDELFKATKCPLPMLEDLELRNLDNRITEVKVPATFLEGSAPHLRRLKLHRISLTSMSSLLSSATMVLELCLRIYAPSTLLLAHLQGMHCLRHLNLRLRTRGTATSINGPMPPTNPEDTFLLSKLTYFHYQGPSSVFNALVAGFTAPSLQDVHIILDHDDEDPILHLPRFLDDVEKLYHSVQMISDGDYFRISLLTHSETVGCATPSFRFCSDYSPDSVMRMSAALSAKLATVEELLMVFLTDSYELRDDDTPWPSFLQHFRRVKVLRVEYEEDVFAIADTLQMDDEPIPDLLPMLEEVEITARGDVFSESPQGQPVMFSELEMAAFRPFLAARQEAGRPVKISRCRKAVFPNSSLFVLFC
ncbi:hypothetical protein BJV74DRAFT_138626 [Russula compacta]|nr:hypothetical protein BJV74DRAFT_138626 [Russula compacta]